LLALDDNAALISPELLRSRPMMSKGNARPSFFENLEDCFLLRQAVAY